MKKVLTLAIILLIALSTSVLATEVSTEAELKAAIEGEATSATIAQDFEITASLKVNKDFTVDLNGHKITGPDDGSSNWYAFIVESGTFTLKDSSEAQTGELYAKCYGVETKGGTFVMESGKITATKNATIGAAVVNYGGKVEIKGGTLLASNWAVNAQGYFADMEVVISGGTLETTSDTEAAVQIGGEYSEKNETVAIRGGTFKGTNAFTVSSEADVTLTGGEYSSDVSEYLDERYAYDEETGTLVCTHADCEEHKEVAATYEKTGTKAYWECNTCGKWFEDKEATKEITDKDSVVIEKLVKTEEPKKDEEPKMGAEISIISILSVVAVIALAGYVVSKRK